MFYGFHIGSRRSIGTIAAFVVAISIVVFVHEFGHFSAARLSGIPVRVFSIGFGTALFSWKDRAGTEWRVGAILLGGYVAFYESNKSDSPESKSASRSSSAPLSMDDAALRHRFLTVVAGPLANFVFSILVFAAATMVSGVITEKAVVGPLKNLPYGTMEVMPGDEIIAVDGAPITNLLDLFEFGGNHLPSEETNYTVLRGGSEMVVLGPAPMPPIVESVRLSSAAFDAGLERNDVILSIDGRTIDSFAQIRDIVLESGGSSLRMNVWRNGTERELDVVGRAEDIPLPGGGFERRTTIGVRGGLFFSPETRIPGPVEALSGAAFQTWNIIWTTMDSIANMVSSQISTCNIQGPIGIAKITGEAASQGFGNFVMLIGLLSTAIGFFNLLPIPPLDGGHLVYYFYEAATGRTVSDSFRKWQIVIGLILLFSLLGLGTANDLLC